MIGVIVFALGSTLVHGVFIFYASFNLLCVLLYRRASATPSRELNPGRVAVLIPVKDDWSLFKALPSVLSLDYPNYQVVVVDDSRDPAFISHLEDEAQGQFVVLRRPQAIGRKGGALNYALEWLRATPPDYVAILDADHRPPPDFLRRAVQHLEVTGGPCVAGWQRHRIGDWGFFGKAYRVAHSACRVNLVSRERMGAAPIFTGSAALFRYPWLQARGFNHSITEDWELSLRAYLGGDSIAFREDLWVDGAIPQGIRWFIRQQMRWAEGTIRDLRYALPTLLRSSLPWQVKVGLIYQGFFWAQSLLAFLSLPLIALGLREGLAMPAALTVGLLGFYFVAWAGLIVRGALLEGYSVGRALAVLGYSYLLMYLMLPFYAYASLRGLLLKQGQWQVTRRRG